jgi:hypothetical protein
MMDDMVDIPTRKEHDLVGDLSVVRESGLVSDGGQHHRRRYIVCFVRSSSIKIPRRTFLVVRRRRDIERPETMMIAAKLCFILLSSSTYGLIDSLACSPFTLSFSCSFYTSSKTAGRGLLRHPNTTGDTQFRLDRCAHIALS